MSFIRVSFIGGSTVAIIYQSVSYYIGGRDYQEGGEDSYRRDGSGGSSGRNYREEDSYRSYGGGRDGESSYSVSGGRNYMGGGGRAPDDHNDDSGGLGAFVDS